MNIFKIKEKTQSNIADKIEDFLVKSPQNHAEIDISMMNLIDAMRTAVLWSVNLFTKYPDKKICWAVKDEETKKAISRLMLKNMELKIKENTTANKVYALK